MNMRHLSFSVLDLVPVVEGKTARDALKNTLDLAQHAERWGYHRYWLAEHHNMPGIASSATSVVIGYVASGTSRIRVGSGGIMLPNHSPLVIAEQFGTLESLYPGRIDLGIGRAPGTDGLTALALRRGPGSDGNDFPERLEELRTYFDPSRSPYPLRVRAMPGEGLRIPIWLLGSSDFSARLAAELGLPFAFASHFAPDYLMHALELYRSRFKPSEELAEPRVMIGVNVIAADTAEEAERIASSLYMQFLNLIRGRPGKLQPPVERIEEMDRIWTPEERAVLSKQLAFTVIGDHRAVRDKLQQIAEMTKADEIIIGAHIYDHEARLRSYEIVAEAVGMM
jgi:luciferase family oxidoreductase group 1